MQVNAIFSAIAMNDKKINTTITHLRASQKAQAPALCQALNALTTNEFEGAKVNEMNVDLDGKPIPTLELSSWESIGSYYYANVTYTGNGNLYIQCSEPAFFVESRRIQVSPRSGNSFTGTIYATETDNYSAVTRNFSR